MKKSFQALHTLTLRRVPHCVQLQQRSDHDNTDTSLRQLQASLGFVCRLSQLRIQVLWRFCCTATYFSKHGCFSILPVTLSCLPTMVYRLPVQEQTRKYLHNRVSQRQSNGPKHTRFQSCCLFHPQSLATGTNRQSPILRSLQNAV